MNNKLLFSTNTKELPKWDKTGDEFLNVEFKLQGVLYNFNLKKDLRDYKFDDPTTVGLALSRQPAQYFKWASMKEILQKQLSKVEMNFDIWHAKQRKIVRKKLIKDAADNDTKNPTREDIEQEIKLLEDYPKRIEYLDSLKFRLSIISVAVNAWVQKKDMLQSINKLLTTLIEHKLE